MTEEQFKVANNMRKYGGSFIKNLGEALLHADPKNAAKIKEMWPIEWQRYLEWQH